MVRKSDHVRSKTRKCAVSRFSSHFFDASTGNSIDADAHDPNRDAQGSTNALAVRRPPVCIWRQAVMNMNGREFKCAGAMLICENVQQDGRVKATGICQAYDRPGLADQ